MTINHVFLLVSAAKLPALRSFYAKILQPLGYTELLAADSLGLYGYGTDYPYFWLKPLAPNQQPVPTHIAFDASDNAAVDQFFKAAINAGATDNGKPGIREEMSRQPYYSAFILDPDGNNIEAVCVDKAGRKK